MIFKMPISKSVSFFRSKSKVPVRQTKNCGRSFEQALHSPSGSSGDLRKESVGTGYYLSGKEFFLEFLIIHFLSNVSKEHIESIRIILLKML